MVVVSSPGSPVVAVTAEVASAEVSVVMPVASALVETLVEAVDAAPVEDSADASASWVPSLPQAARASATVTWWIAGERWRIGGEGEVARGCPDGSLQLLACHASFE